MHGLGRNIGQEVNCNSVGEALLPAGNKLSVPVAGLSTKGDPSLRGFQQAFLTPFSPYPHPTSLMVLEGSIHVQNGSGDI